MIKSSIFLLSSVAALIAAVMIFQGNITFSQFPISRTITSPVQPTLNSQRTVSASFAAFPNTTSNAEIGSKNTTVIDNAPSPQATIVPIPTAPATSGLSIVTRTETKQYLTLGDHRVRSDIVEIRLSQFPKPEQDNGRGLHWFPTTSQKPEVIDRFIPELVAMKIRWLVILQGMEDWNLTANDYLVDQLNAAGITPVMRLELKVGQTDLGRVESVVAHYRGRGVRYFQIFNEPNVREEWNSIAFPTPKELIEYWIPIAEIVAQQGGLPGLAPLSPTTDPADEIFLEQEFQVLLHEKRYDLINIMWLAIHNYGGMDEKGFLRYQSYARIAKFYFRQSIPMIATEGGMGDANTSADTVANAFDAMKTREPYFLAYCPWLIGNAVGGGHDDTWESQAWFQLAGPMPIVQRVKSLE